MTEVSHLSRHGIVLLQHVEVMLYDTPPALLKGTRGDGYSLLILYVYNLLNS